MALASSSSLGCISFLGSAGAQSAGFLSYQSIAVQLHLGMLPTDDSLVTECFQPCLGISDELCVSSSSFSSSGSIKVAGRMCCRSIQTSSSSGTLLDGNSLVSQNSQHVGRHLSSVSHCKGPCL